MYLSCFGRPIEECLTQASSSCLSVASTIVFLLSFPFSDLFLSVTRAPSTIAENPNCSFLQLVKYFHMGSVMVEIHKDLISLPKLLSPYTQPCDLAAGVLLSGSTSISLKRKYLASESAKSIRV